jgi:hypothetical protein
MLYAGIMFYMGILVTALVVGFFSLKTVNSRNALIKAALYRYFMNYTEAKSEAQEKDASLPSVAYGMAIRKFKNMNDDSEDYSFCFEVLNCQVKIFGGRNSMLLAARRRHFPK